MTTDSSANAIRTGHFGNTRSSLLAAVAAVTVAWVTVACSSSEEQRAEAAKDQSTDTTLTDLRQDADRLTDTLQNYGADRRDEALRRIDTAVAELDQRIAAFESRVDSRMDSMSDSARQAAQSNLEKVEQRREKLTASIAALQQDSDDAWQEVKAGFQDAYTAVREALADAESEFSS